MKVVLCFHRTPDGPRLFHAYDEVEAGSGSAPPASLLPALDALGDCDGWAAVLVDTDSVDADFDVLLPEQDGAQ